MVTERAPEQLFPSQHLGSVCGSDSRSRVFNNQGSLPFPILQMSMSDQTSTLASSQALRRKRCLQRGCQSVPRRCWGATVYTSKCKHHKQSLCCASILHPFLNIQCSSLKQRMHHTAVWANLDTTGTKRNPSQPEFALSKWHCWIAVGWGTDF